jgi:hypothetical protein
MATKIIKDEFILPFLAKILAMEIDDDGQVAVLPPVVPAVVINNTRNTKTLGKHKFRRVRRRAERVLKRRIQKRALWRAMCFWICYELDHIESIQSEMDLEIDCFLDRLESGNSLWPLV